MLVEGQTAEGGLAGAAIVEEQGTRFGQARPGGGERGIGVDGKLEVPGRRPEVIGGAAPQVLLALRKGLCRRGGRLRGRGHGEQQDASPKDGKISHWPQSIAPVMIRGCL